MIPSNDLVGAARSALAEARRTGRFRGAKVDGADVKSAARMIKAKYGQKAFSDFLTKKGSDISARVILSDARYGYDEVDYPRGEPKLPRGSLRPINDAPSEMGRINNILLRGGVSQRGLR